MSTNSVRPLFCLELDGGTIPPSVTGASKAGPEEVFVMSSLPSTGEWHLSNNFVSDDPPFAILHVEFGTKRGTAGYGTLETQLSAISILGNNKFRADYHMGKNRGRLEALYHEDQTLTVEFTGSVKTSVIARPTSSMQFKILFSEKRPTAHTPEKSSTESKK